MTTVRRRHMGVVFVRRIGGRPGDRDANISEEAAGNFLGRTNRPRRNIGLNAEVDDEIGGVEPSTSEQRR